jgi:GAF domain-containing protein
MDAISEQTRSFSEIVSRIYAVVKWEDMGHALLQLVAKFFDVDRGAILRFSDDSDEFETAASLWVDDKEIRRQVLSWKPKLPGLSTQSNPAGQDVYLLRRHPSTPAHNVSKIFRHLSSSQKESSLVGIIGKHQQANCLIWLYRNADKPDFRPYDLELLKMVLLHMRQALDFRQQIDNLKVHLRGNGYIA